MNSALLGLCLAASAIAQGDRYSLEDVLHGLEDAEKNLVNFSVTSRIETLQVPRAGDGEGTKARSIATYTVTSDGKSRYKCDLLGQPDGIQSSLIETFDLREFRSVAGYGPEGKLFERYTQGKISAKGSDRSWPVDPWDYTTKFTGLSVVGLLKEFGVEEFDPATRWEGRSVVRIVRKPIHTDQEYKSQYLVDPERGFAIVRKASLVRSTPASEWFEFRGMEGRDYIEVGPNIWVPQRFLIEVHQPVSTNPTPVLRYRGTIRNRDWVVNEDVPDSTFKLEFPGDVLVTDTVRGKTFRTARITDQSLADSAAERRAMRFAGRWEPPDAR